MVSTRIFTLRLLTENCVLGYINKKPPKPMDKPENEFLTKNKHENTLARAAEYPIISRAPIGASQRKIGSFAPLRHIFKEKTTRIQQQPMAHWCWCALSPLSSVVSHPRLPRLTGILHMRRYAFPPSHTSIDTRFPRLTLRARYAPNPVSATSLRPTHPTQGA